MGAEATIGKVIATSNAVNVNISFSHELPKCIGCRAINGIQIEDRNVKAFCASVEAGGNATVATIIGLVKNPNLLIILNDITERFNCTIDPNTLMQKIVQVI